LANEELNNDEDETGKVDDLKGVKEVKDEVE
jgi:hypothetical protein